MPASDPSGREPGTDPLQGEGQNLFERQPVLPIRFALLPEYGSAISIAESLEPSLSHYALSGSLENHMS